MLTIPQLESLLEIARMLDSQYSSQCDRNFGDRDAMTRHVMDGLEKFSEDHDTSPYDLFEKLLREAKAQLKEDDNDQPV